jgi:signal transduction histidine kinase
VRLAGHWRGLLAALLLAGCGGASAVTGCDALIDLDSASRTITGAGPAIDGTERVTLPDRVPGAARTERARIRYEIDVSACAAQAAAALWLFRLGAPYRIHAGGEPLTLLNARALLSPDAVMGRMPLALAGIHNGRIPALFALPAGARQVTVELQTLPYFPTGLVRAQAGPAQALLPVQARAAEAAVAYVDTASVVLLVICLMALLLWSSRRADLALLWLAVTCGLWGWRGLAYFGHRVYLDPLAFEQFNSLNIVLASGALSASILHLLGGMRRWERLTLLANVVLCTLAFGLADALGQGARAVRALCLLSSFVLVGWVTWRAWQGRRGGAGRHRGALLAGLLVLLACGAHDLLLLGGAMAADRPSFIFWGFVALLLGIAFLSARYIVLTLNRAERSNEELEQTIAHKSGELEASYARLRESEQDSARTQERERLLRDMHDGLGALLMTALRGVERGALDREQLTQSLQDSLDELRLLMDSADMAHYLPGALAAWRNRWDHRLAAAGVALEWRIHESLDEVQLPGDKVLQVMRILQEAATNVVKHAHAAHMVLDAGITADAQGPVLRIAIRDDGTGAADGLARPGGRGLRNMQHRAAQVGGDLVVGPAEGGGTEVVLRVPLAVAAPVGIGDQATSPRRAASIAASARDEMPSLR